MIITVNGKQYDTEKMTQEEINADVNKSFKDLQSGFNKVTTELDALKKQKAEEKTPDNTGGIDTEALKKEITEGILSGISPLMQSNKQQLEERSINNARVELKKSLGENYEIMSPIAEKILADNIKNGIDVTKLDANVWTQTTILAASKDEDINLKVAAAKQLYGHDFINPEVMKNANILKQKQEQSEKVIPPNGGGGQDHVNQKEEKTIDNMQDAESALMETLVAKTQE